MQKPKRQHKLPPVMPRPRLRRGADAVIAAFEGAREADREAVDLEADRGRAVDRFNEPMDWRGWRVPESKGLQA